MFEALSLDSQLVAEEEEQVREQVRELPDPLRKEYYERLSPKLKDPDTYAVLNYFFLTGLHHMYLDQYARGLINLVILIIGVVLLIMGAAFLGLLCVVVITGLELMSLFRSQVVVAHHNNQCAQDILASLR